VKRTKRSTRPRRRSSRATKRSSSSRRRPSRGLISFNEGIRRLLKVGLSISQVRKIVREAWGDDDKLRIWCDGRIVPEDFVFNHLRFEIAADGRARILPKVGGWAEFPPGVTNEQIRNWKWEPDPNIPGDYRPIANVAWWPPRPKALEDFVFEVEERQIDKLIPEKIRLRKPPGPKPREDWPNVTRRVLKDMTLSRVIELRNSGELHSQLKQKVLDACGFAPKDPDDLNAIVREFLGISGWRDRTRR
jgi:hypothetical protein